VDKRKKTDIKRWPISPTAGDENCKDQKAPLTGAKKCLLVNNNMTANIAAAFPKPIIIKQ
jgi:hypothetical protein